MAASAMRVLRPMFMGLWLPYAFARGLRLTLSVLHLEVRGKRVKSQG
jgi:hypothetical protein